MELLLPLRLFIELLVLSWVVNVWWWVAAKIVERRAKQKR